MAQQTLASTGVLVAKKLTARAFAPYGEVICPESATRKLLINAGTTERFDEAARVDVDGAAILSIFRGAPFAPPHVVAMLERHPRGSQAFVPLDARRPYLVVAAAAAADGSPLAPEAFYVEGGAGVQYRRNVWHHPLLALGATPSDFLVVDRAGDAPGSNLEEAAIPPLRLAFPPPP